MQMHPRKDSLEHNFMGRWFRLPTCKKKKLPVKTPWFLFFYFLKIQVTKNNNKNKRRSNSWTSSTISKSMKQIKHSVIVHRTIRKEFSKRLNQNFSYERKALSNSTTKLVRPTQEQISSINKLKTIQESGAKLAKTTKTLLLRWRNHRQEPENSS